MRHAYVMLQLALYYKRASVLQLQLWHGAEHIYIHSAFEVLIYSNESAFRQPMADRSLLISNITSLEYLLFSYINSYSHALRLYIFH